MAIPTIFTNKGGEKLATYDFYDLAEGTGIVKFYGYCLDTGSGTKAYRLTTNSSIYSASGGSNDQQFGLTRWTETAASSGSREVNFDITFNKPQNIRGSVRANIQSHIQINNPGSTIYLQLRLLKWDGTTETAISSQITTETLTKVAGAIAPFFVVEIPLTELTHFKAGETFRMELIQNFSLSSGSTLHYLYHSPAQQTGGGEIDTDQLIVMVPFVIDV